MKGKPYRCKDCKYFTKTEHNKNDTRGRGLCKLALNGTRRARGTGVYYYSDKECKYFDINSKRNSTVYIHYGDSEFKPQYVGKDDEHSVLFSKMPGLWGSPVDAKYGWKDWCIREGLKNFSETIWFKFKLKPEAEVLHVYKERDILPYVKIPNHLDNKIGGISMYGILKRDELKRDYDAIELHLSQNPGDLHYTIFNTWDCDSIVVWNPDVIIPIYEEQ